MNVTSEINILYFISIIRGKYFEKKNLSQKRKVLPIHKQK